MTQEGFQQHEEVIAEDVGTDQAADAAAWVAQAKRWQRSRSRSQPRTSAAPETVSCHDPRLDNDDVRLLWRLKQLVGSGRLEAQVPQSSGPDTTIAPLCIEKKAD